MRRLTWRRVAGDWLTRTAVIEIAEAGTLKMIGDSGAIAETPSGPLSFRATGGRIAHDASIIRLSDQKEIARFSVGPLHQTLTFDDGDAYQWRSSFLLRKRRWLKSGECVAAVKRGEIAIGEDVAHSDVLIFFGLYLALSGRA